MMGKPGEQPPPQQQQEEPKRGAEEMSLDAPMPPIFGNANQSEGDVFKGINLDDVFSGVFFSPEGDLLDIPSDGDDSLNLTLSSTSISDGASHPQFAQFAVLGGGGSRSGDAPASVGGANGGSGEGAAASAGLNPSRMSSYQLQDLLMTATAEQEGGAKGEEDGAAAAAAAPLLSGPPLPAPTVPGFPQQQGGTEAAAAAAAAEAKVAAEQARAAQQMAVSKAEEAVKAAAAHAQAQTGKPFLGAQGGSGAGAVAEKFHPIPSGTGSGTVGGLPLPTGGVMGPLAPHGVLPVPSTTPAKPAASIGLPQGGGALGGGAGSVGGGGGISAATTGGGVSVAWGRGAYSGAGVTAAPRRQRHKVSSKDLTEEQRIERRERNREHAKRSRVRKKFLLDSLQRSVDAIQAENDSLKGSIVGSLGERGRELVAKCMPADAGGSLVTANPKQATKILDDPDYSLVKALQTAQQNFVITDASLPDNPIVFASGGFLQLTRYKLTEVLGRNCRFLQGPETDPRAVDKIRKAIDEGYDTSVCLLNYRADGTTFWNQFFVASLRDGKGDTVNYVGVQCKVGDDYAKIVVNEQNRLLAAPSASARRGGPQNRPKPQPSIPPGAGAAAAAAAAAAAPGAGAGAGAGAGSGPGV